jgi:hypothetical protein
MTTDPSVLWPGSRRRDLLLAGVRRRQRARRADVCRGGDGNGTLRAPDRGRYGARRRSTDAREGAPHPWPCQRLHRRPCHGAPRRHCLRPRRGGHGRDSWRPGRAATAVDNKNPAGQEKTDPYNTFPNNGYECDRNYGIGRSNPAHTGCTAATPPPCPEGEVTNSETGECGPPPCDAATEDCGTPPPACVPTKANSFCSTVQGEHHSRTPGARKPTTQVLGEKVVRTPGVLPFTGAAGVGFLLSSGAIALGLGAGRR